MPAIRRMLRTWSKAFETTRNAIRAPLVKGPQIETPDSVVNAQYNLYNLFMKLNEHHCGSKRAFLPGMHYYNWVCGDSLTAIGYYVYTQDLEPVLSTIDLYQRNQHADGFIPDMPLWTDGPSWREREHLGVGTSPFYVVYLCKVARILRDRVFGEKALDSAGRAMDCVFRHARDGLIVNDGVETFDAVDWPTGFGHCPQTFTCLTTYRGLRDMADLAEWLGRADRADELREQAQQMKETINEKLWMEDLGYY